MDTKKKEAEKPVAQQNGSAPAAAAEKPKSALELLEEDDEFEVRSWLFASTI